MKPSSNEPLWLAILCVLLAVSCSPAAATHNGSYTIATAAPEATLLSIFDGTAEAQINHDGTACFSIVWRTKHTAIVWPPGYTARGNPLAVYDRNSKQVLVAGQKRSIDGRELSLGGGQVVSSRARKVAGCSGFSQSVAFVPTASPMVATPGPAQYDDLRIGEMQEVVDAYRDVFGGLVGDPSSHIVTIFVAPTADPVSVAQAKAALSGVGPAAGSALNPSLESWRVGFATRGPSLATLDVVLSRLQVVQPWRKDVGTKLMGWGIDQARQVVRIGVLEITPTISSDARSAFGNLAVLETAEPAISQ
jgi:hypothetical protein